MRSGSANNARLALRTSHNDVCGCKQIYSNATINYTFSRMRPAVRIPFAPPTRHCEPLSSAIVADGGVRREHRERMLAVAIADTHCARLRKDRGWHPRLFIGPVPA